jgi:hypothetical protein
MLYVKYNTPNPLVFQILDDGQGPEAQKTNRNILSLKSFRTDPVSRLLQFTHWSMGKESTKDHLNYLRSILLCNVV